MDKISKLQLEIISLLDELYDERKIDGTQKYSLLISFAQWKLIFDTTLEENEKKKK